MLYVLQESSNTSLSPDLAIRAQSRRYYIQAK